MFQATMAVPGQVIPDDLDRELAILNREQLFDQITCNCKFSSRKLVGFFNQGGACMPHGKLPTAREAVEAHNGEALSQRMEFDALPQDQQNALIEFLKSLQVLPSGSKSLVVDEHGN